MKKKKKTFYAIKIGREVCDKIVNSWEECEKLVIGYPSVYKSFEHEKEAYKYLENMTPEEVELKLIWNKIHMRSRIKEKFEKELGFNIPKYVIDEIILLKEKKTSKENLLLIINFACLSNKISEKNAHKLKKYISEYIESH